MKKMYGLSLVACLLLGALASSAKVSLPQFFQSGMVIQRGNLFLSGGRLTQERRSVCGSINSKQLLLPIPTGSSVSTYLP